MSSTTSTQPQAPQSASAVDLASSVFGDAIQEFIKSFPPKTKRPVFLEACSKNAVTIGPQDIQHAALRLEETHSRGTPTKIWRFLEPVVRALSDYGGVIDTLCQAYPMPSSLIWGSLKAVLECSKRYLEIYSAIEAQLEQLNVQLRRLKDYEAMFGKSPEMLDLLKTSYVRILKFWVVVEEECSSKGRYKKAFRALTSFNARRLQDILSRITQDTNNVAQLTAILAEQSRRDDSETLGEIYANLLAYQAELRVQAQINKDVAEKREAWNTVRAMGRDLNDHQFQKTQAQRFHQDSCSWLLSNASFSDWFWNSEFPEILVKGGPGMGKSMLCTYAAERARDNFPNSGVLSHYFTFSEPLLATTIYRGMAFELAKPVFEQDEVPAHIIQYIQKMGGNPRELQELIRLLVEELPSVFVFLDGLDEEDDGGGLRWDTAEQVVKFFQSLAAQDGARVRLWLSSQEHKRVRNMTSHLSGPAILHVTEVENGRDIEKYLAQELSPSLVEEEEGIKNLVLRDLGHQAAGNFLWAHLMVEAVRDAPSVEKIQQEIVKGLPKRHEDYYKRKMQSLQVDEHGFVSQILSCITYANRPLSVEELCEAVGMCQTAAGHDLRSERKLLSDSVLDLCSPLVETREVGSDSTRKICVLSHASVRKFLVANPRILHAKAKDTSDHHKDCSISKAKVAESCLKYLMQPRYEQALTPTADGFVTAKGENMSDHHFLTYAAKYWDKHLDDVEYTPERFKQVERFVRSKQFRTCIQIQSLWVQGQFVRWRAVNDRPIFDVMGWRRVFPYWFARAGGASLYHEYYSFVREWGPFLNKVSSSEGPHPGEVDRCFWGALGSQNFLYRFHRQERKFRSFSFPLVEEDESPEACRYFEQIDCSGNNVQVMRLQKTNGSDFQLHCRRWCLNGHRPTNPPQWEQTIMVNRAGWDLYDRPLRKIVIGRPSPVECSEDFHYLRIASSIFYQSPSGAYEKLPGLESVGERHIPVEEIASQGPHLAIATRGRVSKKDLYTSGLADTTVDEVRLSEFLEMTISATATEKSTATSSSKSASQQVSSRSSQPTSVNSSQSSISSRSLSSLDVASENGGLESLSVEESESEEDEFEVESNSAEEMWSEGSTDPPESVELDDAEWNDWASVDEDFDDNLDDGSEPSLKIEDELPQDSDSDDDPVVKESMRPISLDSEDSDSLDSSFSEEFLGSSVASSTDSEENDAGAVLEDILWSQGNRSRNMTDPLAKLEIFSTASGTATLTFHFAQRTPSPLFRSPPVFHPHKPLLVWPIGANDLLFADYQQNTYFTRALRPSAPRSCHIFIQAAFSPCGTYLHLASLQARQLDSPDIKKPPLTTSLHVSTHRLSLHKTTNSPPRLVHRAAVPLGPSDSLPVSLMPYTLTWRPAHVHLTRSGPELDVVRVPLFPPRDAEPQPSSSSSLVLRERLFLPLSAHVRPVYFFPPPDDQAAKGKKKRGQACVVLGGMRGDAVLVSRKVAGAPGGVFFEEGVLGAEWVGKKEGEEGRAKGKGGRLVGKFERFDLKDDCDVVPYLT